MENEREAFMREWDKARGLLIKGHQRSLPRDIIENALEAYDDASAQLERTLPGAIAELVNEQAEDEGLWFTPRQHQRLIYSRSCVNYMPLLKARLSPKIRESE